MNVLTIEQHEHLLKKEMSSCMLTLIPTTILLGFAIGGSVTSVIYTSKITTSITNTNIKVHQANAEIKYAKQLQNKYKLLLKKNTSIK